MINHGLAAVINTASLVGVDHFVRTANARSAQERTAKRFSRSGPWPIATGPLPYEFAGLVSVPSKMRIGRPASGTPPSAVTSHVSCM
jgi:hypothetical protein